MATPGGGDRLNLALGTHDARFAQHRQSLAREASGLAAHGPARRCVGHGKMWVAGLCVGMSASSRRGFHFILFVTGLLNETGHERVYPVDIARRTRFIQAAQALGLTPDEARELLRTPVRCAQHGIQALSATQNGYRERHSGRLVLAEPYEPWEGCHETPQMDETRTVQVFAGTFRNAAAKRMFGWIRAAQSAAPLECAQ